MPAQDPDVLLPQRDFLDRRIADRPDEDAVVGQSGEGGEVGPGQATRQGAPVVDPATLTGDIQGTAPFGKPEPLVLVGGHGHAEPGQVRLPSSLEVLGQIVPFVTGKVEEPAAAVAAGPTRVGACLGREIRSGEDLVESPVELTQVREAVQRRRLLTLLAAFILQRAVPIGPVPPSGRCGESTCKTRGFWSGS